MRPSYLGRYAQNILIIVFFAMVHHLCLGQSVSAKELWLIYEQQDQKSLQFDYRGCFVPSFPGENATTTPSIERQAQKIIENRSGGLLDSDFVTGEQLACGVQYRHKKPVVTKDDDVYVLVRSYLPLICTKNEEPFKPIDAALVTPNAVNAEKLTDAEVKQPSWFMCDLQTKDKGNTKITYTVAVLPEGTKPSNQSLSLRDNTDASLFSDTEVELPRNVRVFDVTTGQRSSVLIGQKIKLIQGFETTLPSATEIEVVSPDSVILLKDDLPTVAKGTVVMVSKRVIPLVLPSQTVIKNNGFQRKLEDRITVDLPLRTKFRIKKDAIVSSPTPIMVTILPVEAAADQGNNAAEPDKPAKKTPTLPTVIGDNKPVIGGEVRVRELYRFRIIAGPVFSSIAVKNRSFSTITNASGEQVISSTRKNDTPVNFPVFLKVYLHPDGRDILESPRWTNPLSEPREWVKRLGAIVGVNLVDSPLKNFYLGLSFELARGVDLVGGAHFSKITQLAGGFADGQSVAPGTVAPQTEKFLTGGFVGINVDIGIIGSWLGGSITNTIRGGFK